MRTGIHPEYKKTLITCACGRVSETRATVDELHVEICSHCHPFFTGRQKLVDTAGRVERFRAKYGDGSGRVPEAAEDRENSEDSEPEAAVAVEEPEASVEASEPEAFEAQEPEGEPEAASEDEPTAEAVEADAAEADEATEPEAEAAEEPEAVLEVQAPDEEAAVTEPAAADEPEESADRDEAESEKS